MTTIYIPGDPMGKPKVRYLTPEQRAFRRTVATLVAGLPELQMASVSIVAVKHRPGRKPAGYPFDWSPGQNWCGAKPDADNIAKTVLDALKYGGVYTDDCKVVHLVVSTVYAAVDEQPHTEITLFDYAITKEPTP